MTTEKDIDWSKTTFEGSRREQLKRWCAMSLRERLEALDQLTARAERIHAIAAKTSSAEVQETRLDYPNRSGKMNEIILYGCAPTPLASYLKALAVLRLVAEQAGDPKATGTWRTDTFVLRTKLDQGELVDFFLHRYQPTPLVAPWNGGSGFYPKDNQEGIQPLAVSPADRFARYRTAINGCRDAIGTFELTESPKEDQKFLFLKFLRSRVDESLLRWMDAAVILTDEDPRYPPLLGTGGNDGRLDFTNNFMQRLVELFDTTTGDPQPQADELLRTALFALPSALLMERSIGQFAPGNAGGPNASSGFEGNARINPWDFVLMLEGALLLASSAARRLESTSAAVLSAPFTVRSRLATEGAAALDDDAQARGEIWLPLWAAPLSLDEVLVLFSEGRAALGARPVRDGLDFARAVTRLGVDRGIESFHRYAFVMRSGKAFLATPLSRIPVRRNPQADLIDELESREWLERVQRYASDGKAPNAFRAVVARLDMALFALAQSPSRSVVQDVLRQLGRIDALCSTSANTRETIGPVPKLSAQWVLRADDGSEEFRIALALAGLWLRGEAEGKARYLGMRPHLAPVSADGTSWDPDSRLACWGTGPIERNLTNVLHRRRLEALRLNAEGELLRSRTGASLDDVQRFLDRQADDWRIAELLTGLACAELDEVVPPQAPENTAPLSAYVLLKPFFTSETLLRNLGWLPADRSLRLPAEIPARLAADDVKAALRLAWQRLRALGVRLPGREPPCAAGLDGPRLLAALMIPLTYAETSRLLRWLELEPEQESSDVTLEQTA